MRASPASFFLQVRAELPRFVINTPPVGNPERPLTVELHLSEQEAINGGTFAVHASRLVRRDGTLLCSDTVHRLQIPSGVADGSQLRLPAQGHVARDGSFGDLWVQVRTGQGDIQHVLLLSRAEARDGGRRELILGSGKKVSIEVPAGATEGMQLRVPGEGNGRAGASAGNLWVTLEIEPELQSAPVFKRSRNRSDWLITLVFALLGVFGFVAAFAFPWSEIGNPVVYIDGRFFVLGFFGLAFALVWHQRWIVTPLRGRARVVALASAGAVLVAIGALTVLLVRWIERFGYALTF